MRRLQLEGQKFGKWTVIKFSETSSRFSLWECICECGTKKIVSGTTLVNGLSKSCGCYRVENAKNLFTTHGETVGGNTREFEIWCSMKDRCDNENYHRFHDYGGRGIKVCERWKDSFTNFLEDMGRRPSDDHSIERIDNNGNYEPSNCIWGTTKIQARNHRRNVYFEHNGERMILTDWANKLEVHQRTLSRYSKKYGFAKAYDRFRKRMRPSLIPHVFGYFI